MAQDFDPYLQWLGISKNEPRPVNAYRLLGVDKFESDPDVIAMNGDKQIEHLRKFSTGPQGELAEKLINSLIKAKLTLLKPDRKATYDEQLRAASQPVAPAAPAPLARVPGGPAPAPPRRAPAQAAAPSDPASWNLETAVAPVVDTGFSSYANMTGRPAAAKAVLAAKPRISMTPWLILAGSVAACAALILVLINRHANDEPVAQTEPAEKTPAPSPKKTPEPKKTPAVTVPAKVVNPVTPPEPEPDPAPAVKPPEPPPPVTPPPAEPTPKTPPKSSKGKSYTAKLGNFNWPPITDPEAPQAVQQDGSNNRVYKSYRYVGTTPRMATIVARGHTASRWRVEQNELTMEMGASATEMLLFGDPNWTDYTVEYEVMAEATNMITPAALLFRCADDEHFQFFLNSYSEAKSLLQAWSFDQEGFRTLENLRGQPIEPVDDTFLNPREWRKFSVTVAGNHVTAKRDAKTLFDQDVKMPANGRVGMKFHAYADTKVRVRNIRVTAADGKKLWEGIPDLPPSLAKAERSLWTKNDLKGWTSFTKPENPTGRWLYGVGQLYAASKNNPPLLLTQDTDFENFYLEIKYAKLHGECVVCLRIPEGQEVDGKQGLRLHFENVTKTAPPGSERPMLLQIALAKDGLQLRINGVTKVQKLFDPTGPSLKGRIGLDLIKPDSEVYIDEILVRRLPDSFRLFETRSGPLLDERGANPPIAQNNPPARNPANNPNPGMNPNTPLAAMNPELQPRGSAVLKELAEKDEDVKKFLEELNKARELCNTKVKKFEEDYTKAFDTEISRARTTTALNVDDRAQLLQTLTQDKKDYETKRRYSLAHPMLAKNIIIGLILTERQRIERVYGLMIDRMLKEKRDDLVLALKKAKEEDPDLQPIKVFSVMYVHYPNSTPVQYDFMGDKTVNVEKRDNFNGTKTMVNNQAVTWAIDGEKRLNIAGPLQYDRNSLEQLQITLDGRQLVNGKSTNTSSIKTGTIIVD